MVARASTGRIAAFLETRCTLRLSNVEDFRLAGISPVSLPEQIPAGRAHFADPGPRKYRIDFDEGRMNDHPDRIRHRYHAGSGRPRIAARLERRCGDAFEASTFRDTARGERRPTSSWPKFADREISAKAATTWIRPTSTLGEADGCNLASDCFEVRLTSEQGPFYAGSSARSVFVREPSDAWTLWERFDTTPRATPIPPFPGPPLSDWVKTYHASAASHPSSKDSALTLLGRSVAGKSVLLLSLLRLGWHFVTDDTLVMTRRVVTFATADQSGYEPGL